MLRPIYTALLYLAAPLVFMLNAWRGLRDPLYRDRPFERFGFTALRPEQPAIWIHAVSVGEVQAAAPLIRALLQLHAQHCIVVTTTTPTGAQRVRSLFPDQIRHAYLPYDLPGAVRRFLDRVRPQRAIVMETEVWPNLYRACRRRGIPVTLVSARLSERSVRRYRRFASVFADVVRDLTIAAQTPADAQRFVAIGADARRVHVMGNIKFDLEVPSQVRTAGAQLRSREFAERAVWVAGSTHAGEEDILIKAHQQLRQSRGDALLVLVPRHPNRFDQVRDWLQSHQIRFASRSRGESAQGVDVLLADTLGELLMLYAAADVAFVGGSLVSHVGGHNLLEPAALGKPILTGPHHANGRDIERLLVDSGAVLQVQTAQELVAALGELLADRARREQMGSKGLAVVETNRGALARALAVLDS